MAHNLFSGLSLGSILILMALGLAVIFGLMGVINMAHGEFMMLGAFTTFVVSELFKQHLPATAFLKALADASETMARLSRGMRDRFGDAAGQDLNVEDPSAAFRYFATLAAQGRPLIKGSPLWKSHGKIVTELSRNPSVTVDVFQLRDRSGRVSFNHWAVAPFEMVYGSRKKSGSAKGMEMVFFEAWADEMIPGSEGRLTNAQWEERIRQGKLFQLPSLIRVKPERRSSK